MSDIREVIEKLEALADPSREVDAYIFCAVHHRDKKPSRNWLYENREEWGVFVSNAPLPGIVFHDAPRYTASVDAAQYGIGTFGPRELFNAGGAQAFVSRHGAVPNLADPYAHAEARTAPIALCIAALKARFPEAQS